MHSESKENISSDVYENNALVSMIIPIYNVEKYLIKCLESVVNQTYQNLEIILVDDGSTDSSGEIADMYCASHDKMTVIHKPNEGLSEARNTGIRLARGEYLYFLDSDDYLEETCIDKLVSTANLWNTDVTMCRIVEIYENSESVQEKQLDSGDVKLLNSRDAIKEIYVNDYPVEYGIICNKLFRKKLFDEIRFPKGKLNEDDAVMVPLYYLCNKIAFLNSHLYYYFRRNDSITGSKSHLNNIDRFDFFRNRDMLFREKNDKELQVLNAKKILNDIYWDYIHGHEVMTDATVKAAGNECKYYCKRYFFELVKHHPKVLIKGLTFLANPKICLFVRKWHVR